MKDQTKIAFALGGLAGNNAHGAGFLQAALEKPELRPTMISCTSGQIMWVYHYLKCLKEEKPDLESIFENHIEETQFYPSRDMNFARLVYQGVPGVFTTDRPRMFADTCRNMYNSMLNNLIEKEHPFLFRRYLESFPCRFLAPRFSSELLQEMSDVLSDGCKGTIGIAFNSYNPASGSEYVYLNRAAKSLLKQGSSNPRRYEPGETHSYSRKTVYQRISAKGVLASLWLYYYGFDSDAEGHLDGAYFREIMLNELTHADKIVVVRPLHFHWSGNLPSNWPEMEDLKTKVSFNGTYVAEKNQILLMNKLYKDLKDVKAVRSKYHEIELVEMEMEKRRGFFGYCFEDMEVFHQAHQQGKEILADMVPAEVAA